MRRGALIARRIPVCPTGHRLRSAVLGNLTEGPVAVALLRGLITSALFLVLGMLEDARLEQRGSHLYAHFALLVMTAILLIRGTLAFYKAWDWAGVEGPVHRLTPRALGMAFGCLLPSLAITHALYFQWADFLEAALRQAL